MTRTAHEAPGDEERPITLAARRAREFFSWVLLRWETLFLLLLCTLLAFRWWSTPEGAGSITAYYPHGKWQIYAADVYAQVVRTLDSSGRNGAQVMPGCVVVDQANWSCPAVLDSQGRAVAQYGFVRAVKGRVEVSDSKMLEPPESWFTWEFAKLGFTRDSGNNTTRAILDVIARIPLQYIGLLVAAYFLSKRRKSIDKNEVKDFDKRAWKGAILIWLGAVLVVSVLMTILWVVNR